MADKKLNIKKLNIEIVLFALIMAIFYGYMMFTNGPWYDELYTYYSFISRGPVYAAIHWPVPNNHVGYSVLSGFLDLFGNQYIGLRGVSFIAAVTNIVLIYCFTLKLLNKNKNEAVNRVLALLASFIYSGAWIINNLSIQGRGYTLAITCLLAAIWSLYKICVEGCGIRDYVMFGMALILGLYILPSSVYWVMPVCLIGGFYLLSKKQTPVMWRLIMTSVIAAIIVVGLYAIIWLAIGANLLSKNAESAYYGLHQVKVILKNPFMSAKTGIDYMLATPYIQSIDRREATLGMPGYFRDLFNQCYSGFGFVMALLMVIIIVTGCVLSVRRFKNNNQYFQWLLVAGLLLIPVIMLLVQSVHPYKRVCSFIMIPVSIGIILLIQLLTAIIANVKVKATVVYLLAVMFGLLLVNKFISYDYNGPLADRENDIHEVVEGYISAGGDINSLNKAYYTDDYQKYVFKFYYDLEPEAVSLEEANVVLVSSDMLDESKDTFDWPMLTAYDDYVVNYIRDNFDNSYQTKEYTLYTR